MKGCATCGKFLDNERKKRCDHCVMQSEMKFESVFLSSFDDPCGGTTLYRIVPKKGIKEIRLHHILYWMIDDYVERKFTPVQNWEKIWDACSGWFDTNLKQKYKGDLQKGIMFSDGNGVIASVQDKKGDYYVIHGSWG